MRIEPDVEVILNMKSMDKDKEAVLGELLYVISNYEKGRIKTRAVWNKSYKNSLRKSIEIMQKATSFMKDNRDITVEEMQPILEFYKKNSLVIFPDSTEIIYEQVTNINDVVFCEQDGKEKLNLEIIEYMETILERCNKALISREKHYKYKISCLLKAFHNLPKVFLNPATQTLGNIGIQPISEKEAIDYAKSYIDKMEEHFEHIQRIYKNPFYVNFKRHSCPVCGKRLDKIKVSRVVNSKSPEAKNFDFQSVDNFMIGNVKFIWTEFRCDNCKRNYSIDEMRKTEKK